MKVNKWNKKTYRALSQASKWIEKRIYQQRGKFTRTMSIMMFKHDVKYKRKNKGWVKVW